MKILFFIITLFFISCQKEALLIQQSNNKLFTVSLLFEFEGCKVYRFEDSGNPHYYTNCTETISEKCTYTKSSRICHDENIINKTE